MDTCETIKVMPWGTDQGEFVEINASDFDAAVHTKYDPDAQPAPKPRAKKVAD